MSDMLDTTEYTQHPNAEIILEKKDGTFTRMDCHWAKNGKIKNSAEVEEIFVSPKEYSSIDFSEIKLEYVQLKEDPTIRRKLLHDTDLDNRVTGDFSRAQPKSQKDKVSFFDMISLKIDYLYAKGEKDTP